LHLIRRNICIDIVGIQTNPKAAVGPPADTTAAAVLAALVSVVAAAAASAKAART
jgi:hypothetical protein